MLRKTKKESSLSFPSSFPFGQVPTSMYFRVWLGRQRVLAPHARCYVALSLPPFFTLPS